MKIEENAAGWETTQNPVVQTTLGKVRGLARDGISLFRGIPYGGHCDGAQRFMPPQPAEPWSDVFDCTQNGPIAMQPGWAGETVHPYFSAHHEERYALPPYDSDFSKLPSLQSENCLTVNLMTPGIDAEKRAVVVYIHGGGFAVGSGNLVMGVDEFAKEQNLVVISVRHRLNVFGYLYLGDFDPKYRESGMAGILDVVLALRWVHDNAEAFGGDPEKVTIMGESGGAMKVSTLLNMPECRGLFRYAIAESGSGPVGDYSRRDAATVASIILKNLGVSETELDKLPQFTSQEILQAALPYINDLRPVADDIHLAYQQEPRYAPHPFAKEIPLLVGSSEDELAAGCFGIPDFEVDETTLLPVLYDFLNRGMPAHPKRGKYTKQQVQNIIDVFKKANQKNDSPRHLFWKIVSIGSILGGGAYFHANERTAQKAAPVYAYLNAYDVPNPTNTGEKYAWHVSDLALQFRMVYYPEADQVSRCMADAWGAFIRTGNPSTQERAWPEYDLENQYTMVLDDVCEVKKSPLKELAEVFEKR